MSRFPHKPQKGQPAIKQLYNSIVQIIDYLPTLTVNGDQKSTYVTKSSAGTIIHSVQSNSTHSKAKEYFAGSGLQMTSGNIFTVNVDDNTIKLVNNQLSCTIQPSGGGESPTNGRFNTIGADNSVNSTLSGCGIVAANLGLSMVDPPPNYYITINETPSGGYNLISCDLTHLTQLFNNDLVADAQADVGSVNFDHYTDAGDFFLNSNTGHRGLGTQISLFRYSLGNTVIDPQTGEEHLVNPIMGLKVDLTVSGGNWIGVSAVPRQVVGFDVDPQELEINCLLTGTYDHYPHTSGFIDIVPITMEDGKTWGVISTNLHAGSGITIDPKTGEISCTSGGGGGGTYHNGRFIDVNGTTIDCTISGIGTIAAGLHKVEDGQLDVQPDYFIVTNPSTDQISCDLTHLTQLYNYDIADNIQVNPATGLMHHHMELGDFFLNGDEEGGNRGLGTKVHFYRHSIGNTVIDPQTHEEHLVNPIMGLKVDLTVSGGTWIGTSGVPRKVAGFDVDPQELQINCLLTGTYDHSPHTRGFIDIVPTIMEDGKTWGVISTNLHAGSGITIDPQTGAICVTGLTPPSAANASGGVVQSKTSFIFEPGIYQAEPNTTYYTSYKNQSNTFKYDAEDLQSYFNTDNIDDSGDIVIALPSVNYPTMVKVTNFDNSNVVVVTQDKKYIVVEDGGMQGWDSGQESDPVDFNQTRVYVFQPTPIHWTDRYSEISGACNQKGGVWWYQKYT